MRSIVLGGTSHPALVAALGGSVGVGYYSDGECHVLRGEDVTGADVFLVQPTPAPVGQHVLELLLLADACRRTGAARVTAVLPYCGSARQDRRTRPGAALGARVVADMLATGRFARVLAVDPHGGSIEGFHDAPLDPLSAVPRLTEALRAYAGGDAVVVAPDLGALKLAHRYADALGLPTAVVHKKRISGEAVAVDDVIGEVAGRRPLLVDDMIVSGSTIVAAAEALRARGAAAAPVVAASHALLVADAAVRLAAAPIARLVTTDTVPLPTTSPFPIDVVPIAPLLAEAIDRLHAGRPLGDLLGLR